MAFDGITIACMAKELNDALAGSRIYKITQPEKDRLLLTLRRGGEQRRLLLSANASLPLACLIPDNLPGPMTAPGFCMLLRKHLQNGRITDISQPGLERILRIGVEHLDELGDLRRKLLIIEIMGKHSNLIFCDDSETIIDSIRHIPASVSSVREVLPGRPYFIPRTQDKKDPLAADEQEFYRLLQNRALPAFKAVYMNYTGISPMIAQEICCRAGTDADKPAQSLSGEELARLWEAFSSMIALVREGAFSPALLYENGKPAEYACVPVISYEPSRQKPYDRVSELLYDYYAEKNAAVLIRQKSAELRHIVQTALERNVRKYDLQQKQIEDTRSRDLYRIYGELLHTYGYQASPGASSLKAVNYYDNTELTIPLDPTLTPAKNAERYFERYNKLKRTFETLSELTVQVGREIEHLESIAASLDIAVREEDLIQIREELTESGYIRRRGKTKAVKVTSRPFHYLSSDGYDIYVGKNNYQNDELTFRLADGGDWWFHVKGMAGSHVIVKTGREGEVPDRTFEEAGRLAAYYSQARWQQKAEIDYTLKKNVKKPSKSAPGFVVYYTNYSLVISPDISGIRLLSD